MVLLVFCKEHKWTNMKTNMSKQLMRSKWIWQASQKLTSFWSPIPTNRIVGIRLGATTCLPPSFLFLQDTALLKILALHGSCAHSKSEQILAPAMRCIVESLEVSNNRRFGPNGCLRMRIHRFPRKRNTNEIFPHYFNVHVGSTPSNNSSSNIGWVTSNCRWPILTSMPVVIRGLDSTWSRKGGKGRAVWCFLGVLKRQV